jgi:hypothetical protein
MVSDPAELRATARRCVRKMAELTSSDGRYLYAYDLESRAPRSGYNLLRHCGAAWATADLGHRLGGEADSVAAALRAMAWLLRERTTELGEGLCVASAKGHAKLGGCGLAILALVALARASGDVGLLDTARRFAACALGFRRPDGDFHHKIEIATGRVMPFRSEYYTGEILFGLAELAAETGDSRYLNAATDSALRLGQRDYGVIEQSHWMLYSLARLWQMTGHPGLPAHAGRIAASILRNPDYRARGMSAPTACRMEGLAAYLSILASGAEAGDGPGVAAVRAHLLRDLRQLQEFTWPDGAVARGRHGRRVQIDYIQHAASAYFGMAEHGFP